MLVALETELSAELIAEGLAREFVNKVQNMRKSSGLEVTQRINVQFQADADLCKAVLDQSDYIKSETLTVECVAVETAPPESIEWDLNGHTCMISIEKIDY